MPDSTTIRLFERRLIELGCPGRRLSASVRELEDHYQDLVEVALTEGCGDREAEVRAAAQLGHPVVLAENLVMGLRQASWWGRHPIIGFCLCPLFSLAVIWLACLGVLVGIGWFWGWLLGPAYAFDESAMTAFQSNSIAFEGLVRPLMLSIETVSAIFLTAGFCWLAWRAALGWKWVVATCAACALACLVFYVSVQPQNLTVGLRWHQPHWPLVLIPLAVGMMVIWRQRTMEGTLPPLPAAPHPTLPAPRALRKRLGVWLRMPTYWITTILVALLLLAAAMQTVQSRHYAAHRAQLKNQIWPAERAATLARLQARQQLDAGVHETTINLKPWINASLEADELAGIPGKAKGNNLASLPTGAHVYAGVPFDVEGRLQLYGRSQFYMQQRWATLYKQQRWATQIKNIVVGGRCDRLQVLHGACDVQVSGQRLAGLVLHYTDGSSAEIPIVSGEHVLGWWGPIYDTDSPWDRNPTDPGTELAWAGINPSIHKHAPELSLRLYRSAFDNPHPDLEIASIDYVSGLKHASPFLLGLTLETKNHQPQTPLTP